MRSSSATRRRSSNRAISPWAKGSNVKSASGGPRQRSSASRRSCDAPLRVGRSQRLPALLEQLFEAVAVEPAAADLEHVPRPPRHEQAVPERPAQVRDVVLDDLCRRRRGSFAPELIDQPLDRDGLVRMRDQQRQEGALSAAAEWDRSIARADLERSEDSELHRPVMTVTPWFPPA
jgi:hypothetical protein